MLKPICVPCQRFYRCKKNGRYFIEAAPNGSDALPGRADPSDWHPYKLWSGDLWECPDCGAEIISGVGLEPISVQHEQPRFGELLQTLVPDGFQVNDC